MTALKSAVWTVASKAFGKAAWKVARWAGWRVGRMEFSLVDTSVAWLAEKKAQRWVEGMVAMSAEMLVLRRVGGKVAV